MIDLQSPYNNSSIRGRSGVLIVIDSTLKSKILNVSNKCDEQVFVQHNLGSNISIFACVYIPSLSPFILYEKCFLVINEIYLSNPKAKLILSGFNLPIKFTH